MSCLASHNRVRKRWSQARGQLSRYPAQGSLVPSQLPAVLWRQAPGHPETHRQAAGGQLAGGIGSRDVLDQRLGPQPRLFSWGGG